MRDQPHVPLVERPASRASRPSLEAQHCELGVLVKVWMLNVMPVAAVVGAVAAVAVSYVALVAR